MYEPDLPARDARRVDTDRPIRSKNKKKDLANYCRGNPKTPHQPEFVYRHTFNYTVTCRWDTGYYLYRRPIPQFRKPAEKYGRARRDFYRWHWRCWHAIECSNCGKVMAFMLRNEECPDFHEWTEDDYPDDQRPLPGEPEGPQ